MKKDLVDFNLRLFGESGQDNGQENGGTSDPSTENPEGEVKTYTQEEVDELLKGLLTQDQVNDIVKDRIAREKKKAEEEAKKQQRLSKLSAEERAKEEAEETKKELEEARAKIERMELEQDTTSVLEEQKIPLVFKSFLIQEDAETTNKNINIFKATFDAEIEKAVKEQLKGNSPNVGSNGSNVKNPWSKEFFNLTEQGRLKRENPELAEKLRTQV